VNTDSAPLRRAIGWSSGGELLTRLLAPVLFLVLARLLVPADFGLLAVPIAVAALAQALWEQGLSRAIVACPEPVLPQAVAWAGRRAMTWGAVLAIMLIAASWPLAHAAGAPSSAGAIALQGLGLPIAAFGCIQAAILTRRLAGGRLLAGRLVGALTPGVIAIPLAMAGWGAYALAAGALAGNVLQAITWRFVVPTLPPPLKSGEPTGWDAHLARWSSIEAFTAWSIAWGDMLIAGICLGASDAGIYRIATAVASAGTGILLAGVPGLMHAVFVRAADHPPTLFDAWRRGALACAWAAAGLGVAAAACAPALPGSIIPAHWQGADLAVVTMLAAGSLSSMSILGPELCRAVGKPNLVPRLYLALAAIGLPGLALAASHSFHAFLIMRLAIAFVALPCHVLLVRHAAGVQAWAGMNRLMIPWLVALPFITGGVWLHLQGGLAPWPALFAGGSILTGFLAIAVITVWPRLAPLRVTERGGHA